MAFAQKRLGRPPSQLELKDISSSLVSDFLDHLEATREQAALRAWMRNIVLPGNLCRSDLDRVRRSEKESVDARDRRILEFPLSMSPKDVAKALKAGDAITRERRFTTSSIALGDCENRLNAARTS
ncbi:MAG TPA: hypothetical protein VIS99_08005 [Terrimicrobiaceae bacterium]